MDNTQTNCNMQRCKRCREMLSHHVTSHMLYTRSDVIRCDQPTKNSAAEALPVCSSCCATAVTSADPVDVAMPLAGGPGA